MPKAPEEQTSFLPPEPKVNVPNREDLDGLQPLYERHENPKARPWLDSSPDLRVSDQINAVYQQRAEVQRQIVSSSTRPTNIIPSLTPAEPGEGYPLAEGRNILETKVGQDLNAPPTRAQETRANAVMRKAASTPGVPIPVTLATPLRRRVRRRGH